LSSYLCRHPRVFIRRTAWVLASQNLVGYESQNSAREIRNRFKVAKGSRQAFYSLCPRPESRFIGNNRLFRPSLKSQSWGTIGSFTAVAVRPRPKNNRLFRPRPERADRLFTGSAKRSRTPARVGPGFWRTIHAHVACARPSPEARARPGPARRGERARACVLPSSSHPHLEEHGEHPTI
jgi:hypothetical protein